MDFLACSDAFQAIISSQSADFTRRLLLGVHDGSPYTFLSVFAERVRTLPPHCQLSANRLVHALAYVPTRHSGPFEREMLHAFFRSKPLHDYLCWTMVIPDTVDSSPGFNADLIVVPALRTIVQCLLNAKNESPQESEVFIKSLLRAGIFDALEKVLLQRTDKIAELPCTYQK